MKKDITSVSFRIDTQLKNEADELFKSLGLTMTSAFNIFLRKCVKEKGIPFPVTIECYNKETIEALKEADALSKNPNIKTFNNVDELLAYLKK